MQEVSAGAVHHRLRCTAPLSGRRLYRVRLTFPDLPIAQGQFRLYAFLGDETALHLHDLRVLRPGFTVVSPDYAVGLDNLMNFYDLNMDDKEAGIAHNLQRKTG